MEKSSGMERLRIILAITGKDIRDALRNKILISIMIGVALVVAQGKALPLLLKLSDTARVAIYNQADESLITTLRAGGGMEVIEVASPQELGTILAEASGDMIGFVIPAAFGEGGDRDSALTIEGFYPYWMDLEEITELEVIAESELSAAIGVPVDIDTQGNAVHPQEDSGGQPFMTALIVVLLTTMICVIIVPYLMVEEKEAHTLEALLVSPAKASEVVIGKALAGLTYGFAAGAVVMLFYQAQIVHWWIVIAACVIGSMFAIALGLLLGSLFNNMANMNLWMSLLLVILIAPVLLIRYMPPQWPAIISDILPWWPTVALYRSYMLSFTASPSILQVWIYLGVVLASAIVVLAIVARIVRRSDR
jgi:ABC-type multidrug transport system permease subunit